jgi:hypothetical protein
VARKRYSRTGLQKRMNLALRKDHTKDETFHDSESSDPFEPLFTIALLVATVIAVCVVILGCMAVIRGNTGARDLRVISLARVIRSKSFDHIAYALSVASAMILTVAAVKTRAPRRGWRAVAASLVAATGLGVGIAAIEEPRLVLAYGFWSGFGISVLLLTTALVPFIWRIIEWKNLPRAVRGFISTVVLAVCVSGGLGLIRPVYLVADPGNDLYMLNEMLAPAAGKIPDANFVPLYEVLYGWLFKPFAGHLSPTDLTAEACIIFTVFTVAAVVLGVVIAHRALGRRSLTLAMAFAVPFSCVVVAHNPINNLAGAFQDTPIRLFPGMLLGAFAIEELVRMRQGRVSRLRIALLGVLSSVVAWSNHDFGLISVIVLGALVFLSSTRQFAGKRSLVYWLLGLVLGLSAYPLWATARGASISFRYVFFFQSSFGSGYGKYPMQLPGPVLAVMPMVIVAASVGCYSLWTQSKGRKNDSVSQDQWSVYLDRAALTAAFFGTWSLVAFVYYLNRSIAAGQLEIFLLPCGVSLAALVALVIGPVSDLRLGRLKSWTVPESRRWQLRLLPLSMLAALPFGAMLQTENPVEAIQILRHAPPGRSFGWPSVSGVVAAREFAAHQHQTLSYFGAWGNYVQLATGVNSVALVDHPPAESTVTKGSIDCSYIRQHLSGLLVTDTDFGAYICGVYTVTPVAVAPGVFLYSQAVVPLLSRDWYSDNWVGPTGEATILSPKAGEVTISAFVPSFLDTNRIRLTVNDKVVFNGVIGGGATRSIRVELGPRTNVIAIACSRAVAPVSIKQGADVRRLGVHLELQSSLFG